MFEGPVVRPLRIFREAAAGKLALFDVVLDALAADPLAGTGIVGAGAACKVLFLIAVHDHSPVERVLDLHIAQAQTMLVEFRDSEIAGQGKRRNGLAPASHPEHPESRNGKLHKYKQKGFDFGAFFCYHLM
jgi:hypothetical protein